MEVFGIVSAIFIALLVIGFLLGFWRNWKKSLSRFVILTAVLILSIFIAPVISNAIISGNTSGSVLSFAGFSIDFEELLSGFVGEDIMADLSVASGTTNNLVISVMHIVVNIAMFLLMFIVVSLFSLIVYWIVCGIFHSKNKKKGLEKPKHGGAWWGLRSLGGVFGVLGMFVLSFAILTPVFGAMNICNAFIATNSDEGKANAAGIERVYANAAGFYVSGNLIAGKVYNNETVDQIEGYIGTYEDLKNAYDKSPVGAIFNGLGISTLGAKSFEHLSSVKHGDLEFDLTNEVVAIANTYNDYKAIFLDKQFDLKNNDDIQSVVNMYDKLINSKVLSKYAENLLPTLCERWSNDETFFGLSLPLEGESAKYAPMAKVVLKIFSTKDIKRISANIKVLANAIKIANNNNLIESFEQKDFDLLKYFQNDTKFIKEEILNLSQTVEFRNNMPSLFNHLIEQVYGIILGNVKSFAENELNAEQIAEIIWDDEALYIQNIVTNLAKVSGGVAKESGNESLLGFLEPLGTALDNARYSKMLNAPVKTLVEDLIVSDKFPMNTNVKTTISGTISGKWNDKACSFAAMFVTIEETANIAKNLAENLASGNVDLSVLEDSLTNVVNSDALKETISQVVNDGVIKELVGNDTQQTKVLSGILDGFVNSEVKITDVGAELKAAQTIVDLTKATTDGTGSFLAGENEDEKKQAAKSMAESLNGSALVVEILQKAEDATEYENDVYLGIKDTISSIKTSGNADDLNLLKQSINELEDGTNKEFLQNLFK